MHKKPLPEPKPSLIVKYHGVRGSIPAPLTTEQIQAKALALIQHLTKQGGTETLFGPNPSPEQLQEYLQTLPLSLTGTYGGDTTCLEIQARDSPLIIIDAGTGIRKLGQDVLARLFSNQNLNPLNTDPETQKDLHLLFTHYHWDHLQGFPFFGPGFIPGDMKVNLIFYGKKDARTRLSEVLEGQQQYPNFPVVWCDMPCQKHYLELPRLGPLPKQIGQATITYQELDHPDSVFAYAIQIDNKKFVCATDTEHKDSPDPRLVALAKDADLLYYDSQYTPEDYLGAPGSLTGNFPKFDWGHSTYQWAINNALAANAKTVVLGHHDPVRDDFQLEDLTQRAHQYLEQQLHLPENQHKQLEVITAYQGLEQRL